jgi:hypothetical protein
MSATSRRIVGLVLGFVAPAMVIYATLAMLGIVAI